MRRRCSMTSGTPPAMNTCTVGWSRGPFGSASTRRGVARLTRSQSSTVGGRRPAACASAGMCSSRLVEPPNAACTSIAFSSACGVRMAASVSRRAASRTRARADCRAISSQTGSPDGLSALCGSARPNASATTCAVAAVPRNWQPPPGVPQARQPSSAASSSADEPVREPRADRLHLARVLGADRRQRHAAGHDDAREVAAASQREQRRGKAFVAGRDPHDARPARQRPDQAAHRDRRVVAVGQAVEHPGRSLRAPVAGIAAVGRERDDALLAQRLGCGPHEQADLPVAGVVAERDRRAVGRRAGRLAC